MTECDILTGAHQLEQVVKNNIGVCKKHFSSHLSNSTRNCHFRAMFGISSCMAFIVWIVMDVDVEGPVGGK